MFCTKQACIQLYIHILGHYIVIFITSFRFKGRSCMHISVNDWSLLVNIFISCPSLTMNEQTNFQLINHSLNYCAVIWLLQTCPVWQMSRALQIIHTEQSVRLACCFRVKSEAESYQQVTKMITCMLFFKPFFKQFFLIFLLNSYYHFKILLLKVEILFQIADWCNEGLMQAF